MRATSKKAYAANWPRKGGRSRPGPDAGAAAESCSRQAGARTATGYRHADSKCCSSPQGRRQRTQTRQHTLCARRPRGTAKAAAESSTQPSQLCSSTQTRARRRRQNCCTARDQATSPSASTESPGRRRSSSNKSTHGCRNSFEYRRRQIRKQGAGNRTRQTGHAALAYAGHTGTQYGCTTGRSDRQGGGTRGRQGSGSAGRDGNPISGAPTTCRTGKPHLSK